MKARLVPLYFDPGRDSDFDKMLEALRPLLAERVELLGYDHLVRHFSRIPASDRIVHIDIDPTTIRAIPSSDALMLHFDTVTAVRG